MDEYRDELGAKLRRVRLSQGLTLADVEERSGGEWKAVVVGSYERGDRAVTVARLSSLAEFYGVPVGHLLPVNGEAQRTGQPTIDLNVLAAHADRFPTLVRFVRRIQQERGDFNGRVLTLRDADLRTVAAADGVSFEELVAALRERELLIV